MRQKVIYKTRQEAKKCKGKREVVTHIGKDEYTNMDIFDFCEWNRTKKIGKITK